jgi:peptide deformylase
MSLLPIRRAGDPVLRQKASRVNKIDRSVLKLVEDMFETMYDAPGVGLAAPQIGVPLRIIVVDVREEPAFALINPEFVKRSGERRLDEGCLSVPGYRGSLTRSEKVTVKGLNLEGKEVRIKAEGTLLAQCLEHELDHLNGTLYIDHIDDASDLITIEEYRRLHPPEEGDQPEE